MTVHPGIKLYKQEQRGKLTYAYHFEDKEANWVTLHPGSKTIECVSNARTLAVCRCNAGVGTIGITCPSDGSFSCAQCRPGYTLAGR